MAKGRSEWSNTFGPVMDGEAWHRVVGKRKAGRRGREPSLAISAYNSVAVVSLARAAAQETPVGYLLVSSE